LTTLDAVARKNGLALKDYVPSRWDNEGYALWLGDYVVVVLRGWTHTIPGHDTQTHLLLDRGGRPLDRLSCSINSRLTHMEEGVFRTEAFRRPEADGARLVVRFIPNDGGKPSGHWSHSITCGGKEDWFGWDDCGRRGAPLDWSLGLCRLAVRDGKFDVLFPRLGQGTGR
jgi:hypothetical protein